MLWGTLILKKHIWSSKRPDSRAWNITVGENCWRATSYILLNISIKKMTYFNFLLYITWKDKNINFMKMNFSSSINFVLSKKKNTIPAINSFPMYFFLDLIDFNFYCISKFLRNSKRNRSFFVSCNWGKFVNVWKKK